MPFPPIPDEKTKQLCQKQVDDFIENVKSTNSIDDIKRKMTKTLDSLSTVQRSVFKGMLWDRLDQEREALPQEIDAKGRYTNVNPERQKIFQVSLMVYYDSINRLGESAGKYRSNVSYTEGRYYDTKAKAKTRESYEEFAAALYDVASEKYNMSDERFFDSKTQHDLNEAPAQIVKNYLKAFEVPDDEKRLIEQIKDDLDFEEKNCSRLYDEMVYHYHAYAFVHNVKGGDAVEAAKMYHEATDAWGLDSAVSNGFLYIDGSGAMKKAQENITSKFDSEFKSALAGISRSNNVFPFGTDTYSRLDGLNLGSARAKDTAKRGEQFLIRNSSTRNSYFSAICNMNQSGEKAQGLYTYIVNPSSSFGSNEALANEFKKLQDDLNETDPFYVWSNTSEFRSLKTKLQETIDVFNQAKTPENMQKAEEKINELLEISDKYSARKQREFTTSKKDRDIDRFKVSSKITALAEAYIVKKDMRDLYEVVNDQMKNPKYEKNFDMLNRAANAFVKGFKSYSEHPKQVLFYNQLANNMQLVQKYMKDTMVKTNENAQPESAMKVFCDLLKEKGITQQQINSLREHGRAMMDAYEKNQKMDPEKAKAKKEPVQQKTAVQNPVI